MASASDSKYIYAANTPSYPYTIGVSWSESNTNPATNTSVISISGYISVSQTSWDSSYLSYLNLYWYDNYTNTKKLIATSAGFAGLGSRSGYPNSRSVSGTVTVTHKPDGSLSGWASLAYSAGSTSGGWAPPSNEIGTNTTVLATIPRASAISSITGSKLNSLVSISIERKVSTYTHKVEYSFAGSEYTTTHADATTSASFTPPIALASRIPNSTTGALTVRVTTYDGRYQIGSTVTKSINLTLPDNIVPTMGSPTATRVDNGVPSSWGVYVKSFSKVTINIVSPVGIYGSTIKSYSISGPGLSATTSSETSDVINNSGTLTYTCVVTDSRGKTVTKTVSISVIDYSIPSVYVTADRCDSLGNIIADGTYLKVIIDYVYASVSSKNSLSTKSASCNGVSNTTFSDGASFILAANCSIGNKYTLSVSIKDALGKTASTTVLINTSKRIINIRANKQGIAFGKFSEKDAFEVAMPSEFLENSTFKKSVNFSGGNPFDVLGYRINNGLTIYTSEGIDANTTLDHLILTTKNTPTAGTYFYIMTFFYSTKSTTSNRTQLAIHYSSTGAVYQRTYFNGGWGAWTRLARANEVVYNSGGVYSGSYGFEDLQRDGKTVVASRRMDELGVCTDLSNIFKNSTEGYIEFMTGTGAKGINYVNSDLKLKNSITESAINALERINKIQMYDFYFNTGGHVDNGFIANQLADVDENLVSELTEEDETKTLFPNQTTIVQLLTKAVQELSDKVSKLEAINNDNNETK